MTQQSDSGKLVQLHARRLRIDRVKDSEAVVFETHLEDHQRIVAVEHHFVNEPRRRKTADHSVTVWIESRLQ